jgi:hypothetical protein
VRPAKPSRPARRPPTAAPLKPPRPAPSETALLALARTVATETSAASSPRAAVTRAVEVLAAAFETGAPLPRLLAQGRAAGRRDDARTLATAWAREQLRLSLTEVLARGRAAGVTGAEPRADALAWLVLAACEALGDEPPQAVPDRIRLLAEWLTGVAPDD